MTGKVTLVLSLIAARAEVNAQSGYYGNAQQAALSRGDEQVARHRYPNPSCYIIVKSTIDGKLEYTKSGFRMYLHVNIAS